MISLKNDEIVLLGAILGGESIIGVENVFEQSTPEFIREAWGKAQASLIERGYIEKSGEDEHINEDIVRGINAMIQPDYVYIVLIDDKINNYFYVRNNIGLYMHSNSVEDVCEIQVFEEFNLFKQKMIEIFKLNDVEQEYECTIAVSKDDAEMIIENIHSDNKQDLQKYFEAQGINKRTTDSIVRAMKIDSNIHIYARQYMDNKLINESYNKLYIQDDNTWLLRNSVYKDRETIIFSKDRVENIINNIVVI